MTIGKGMRFEVLKRDQFTCQYCGAKAPDVLLHVDHVHPESKGGETTMLNLVTACAGCNLGKSDRLLADDAAVTKQQAQMEQIAARREQVQLLVEWRAELAAIDEELAGLAGEVFTRLTGLAPSSADTDAFRRLIKKYSFTEVFDALDDAAAQYVKSKPVADAVASRLVNALPRICAAKKNGDYELQRRAAYAAGIVRNRFPDRPWRAKSAIEMALQRGVQAEAVNHICRTETSMHDLIESLWAVEP